MLSKILYSIILTPISRAPFGLLYGISNICYVILFYFVGYRKQVVMNNLKSSFPEKEDTELKEIQKAFYKHFCDLIIESIKGFTISEEEARKRMTYTGTEVLEELAKKKKSAVMIGGHYANWEWYAITADQQIPHQAVALYTPIKSKYWDTKMKSSRSRFGLKMVSIRGVKQLFEQEKSNLTATIFASDQSPRKPERAYWTTFLNQDTGIQYGAEKFAKEHNMSVVFGTITKLKRGHYTTNYQLLFEEVSDLQDGAIMEAYSQALERQIKADPRYYLWSHKRWKHKRPNRS